jgi:hypothetical protein
MNEGTDPPTEYEKLITPHMKNSSRRALDARLVMLERILRNSTRTVAFAICGDA